MSDSTTNLDLISESQAQKEVTANSLFDAMSPSATMGRRASTTAALSWGYYGGIVMLDDGTLLQVSNGVKTLTDDADNYLELDTSDGTVDLNTSGWTGASKKRLYKITVASGVVTGYEDWRTCVATPGGGVSDGDKGDITVSSSGTVWTVDSNAITYSKMQDVSATDKLLGRSTAGAGDIEEIACTAAGRAILDDADAAAQRTTLGLGTAATLASDVDGTLAADSDSRIATQKAVKTYVDAQIAGTSSATVTSVDITPPAAGITASGGPVTTSGSITLALADDLAALEALSGTGIPNRTGSNTWALRTLDTDTTLAANSDTVIATQKAVKAYVDGIVTGGASDVMIFKGVIDCSANPNYPAADAGNLYKVSVAGKIGGASGTNVEVGDTIYCITDSTASGTQAAVGANWVVVQANVDGAVTGPASSTADHVVTFNGTSGKIVKDSGLTLTGTNTGDETTTTLGATVHGATGKTTPVDADEMPLVDSAASNILKKVTWANIKATLKTYFDTLYATVSQPFDAAAFYPGVPTASAKILRIPIARAVTFPGNFSGSYFSASANATSTTVFDVQKNGSSIGSISIAASGTTATFTTTSGTSKSFAAGDVLAIIAPGTADATLADVGFVLAGTR